MSADDILFEWKGRLAVVTLNRPDALNALTLEMARALDRMLVEWADDDGVRAVLVKAAGDRAFCAGGDVRRLYDAGRAGERYPYDFYRDEYRLNARIHHFPKPYVALMNGIVMGGGVGLSVHGSWRVASERTMFAMPETGIGLFPDVGGSWFLPRLPGRIGMYLAMTGARLKAADAVHAGLCDVYVPAARLAQLEESLAAGAEVESTLRRFAQEPGPATLPDQREDIDRCFAGYDAGGFLRALDAGGEWGRKTAETLRAKSPSSVKMTIQQLRYGARLAFNDCMRMEYRLACACVRGHDFYEGVRAVIVDKDQAPKWRPATLAEVRPQDVREWFESRPPDGDLELPGDRGPADFDERLREERRKDDRRKTDRRARDRRTTNDGAYPPPDRRKASRRLGPRRSGADRRDGQ